MHTLSITLSYIFIIISSIMITVRLWYWIYPHRAKIFFSYSHADTAIAENIISTLNKNKFRLWVDFGITIPPDKIGSTLRKLIGNSEILMHLASKNSESSEWVKYEIDIASRSPDATFQTWRCRDYIILALDSQGLQTGELLTAAHKEQRAEYEAMMMQAKDEIAEELVRLRKKSTLGYYVMRFGLKAGGIDDLKTDLTSTPGWKRGFISTVSTFDLRSDYDKALEALAECAKHSTRVGLLDIPFIRALVPYLFVLWSFGLVKCAHLLYYDVGLLEILFWRTSH